MNREKGINRKSEEIFAFWLCYLSLFLFNFISHFSTSDWKVIQSQIHTCYHIPSERKVIPRQVGVTSIWWQACGDTLNQISLWIMTLSSRYNNRTIRNHTRHQLTACSTDAMVGRSHDRFWLEHINTSSLSFFLGGPKLDTMSGYASS